MPTDTRCTHTQTQTECLLFSCQTVVSLSLIKKNNNSLGARARAMELRDVSQFDSEKNARPFRFGDATQALYRIVRPLPLPRLAPHTWTFSLCLRWMLSNRRRTTNNNNNNKNNMRLRLISISSNISCIQHINYFEREEKRNSDDFVSFILLSFVFLLFSSLRSSLSFFRFHFFIEKWRSFRFCRVKHHFSLLWFASGVCNSECVCVAISLFCLHLCAGRNAYVNRAIEAESETRSENKVG